MQQELARQVATLNKPTAVVILSGMAAGMDFAGVKNSGLCSSAVMVEGLALTRWHKYCLVQFPQLVSPTIDVDGKLSDCDAALFIRRKTTIYDLSRGLGQPHVNDRHVPTAAMVAHTSGTMAWRVHGAREGITYTTFAVNLFVHFVT